MAKTIKMVAVINGEEVTVGRCHPGQARILRSNGMAEWAKGKLILPTSLDHMVEAKSRQREADKEAGRGMESLLDLLESRRLGSIKEHLPPEAEVAVATGWRPEGWKKAIEKNPGVQEVIEEADPGGLLRQRPEYPEELRCQTITEFVEEFRRRRDAGHTIYAADDPKRLMVGYVDDTDNQWLYIGLHAFKRATPEEWEELGLDPKEVLDSRDSFFTTDPTFTYRWPSAEERAAAEEELEQAGEELKAIWLGEARAEIFEYEQDADRDLAVELFGLLHPCEIPRPEPEDGA